MKKVVAGSMVSALLALPSFGFELYNNDNTKLDVYASMRGYIGVGHNLSAPEGTGRPNAPTGYLMGLQNNSRFGINFSTGDFRAQVEYGWIENDTSAGWRLYYGAYKTSSGEFLFGRQNSPTTDPGFSSNWLNADTGSLGFGGVALALRRIQVAYKIGGLNIALLEDKAGTGVNTDVTQDGAYRANAQMPRIAVSYTAKDADGNLFLKVGASYVRVSGYGPYYSKYSGPDLHAYHAWFGYKPRFGNAYISFMANAGKNGDLYGEQSTTISTGAYTHGNINGNINENINGNINGNINSNIGYNATRIGAHLEFGYDFSKQFGMAIGGGYQLTTGGSNQYKTTGERDGGINSFAAFINLPYKVSQNLTLAPLVAYYSVAGDTDSKVRFGKENKQSSVIGAVRIKWDF
ncbi:hypothetical protein [Helicobacter sp.]|uniref:hypothetical protein n=1 Tax=Helicobacter sp. TaxID=218 RepID=UPI003751FE55|nr:hypothetical protein [Helicobacter sp.]